jgi:hypothetical protein
MKISENRMTNLAESSEEGYGLNNVVLPMMMMMMMILLHIYQTEKNIKSNFFNK